MSSSAVPSGSPGMTTGVRTRTRLPKAKPNIMGAGRRSTTTTTISTSAATPAPKCATAVAAELSEPPKGNKSPPPVRRMVNTVARYGKLASASNDSSQNQLSMTSETSDELESLQQTVETQITLRNTEIPDVTPPKKISPTQEKQVQQTTSQSVKRVRKNSTRTGTENREKEEAVNFRQKKGKIPPDRAKMTMFDLIYWNPSSNPMTYDDEENRPPLADKVANAPVPSTENSERLAEEAVDDPEFVGEASTEGVGATEPNNDEENSMPVPQVKIGPDGNIILDEKSLVIETSASKTNLSSSPIVYGRQNNTTYASFRNKKQTKTWTDKETAKFYVALSSVGTDFSMMANLFPKRERKELKLKFKREERFNRALVDKAIRDRQQYDLSIFDDSDDELENVEAQSVKGSRKARKKQGADQSKKSMEGNGNGEGEIGKQRKPRRTRRTMQEESDSDYEESNKEMNASDLPRPTEVQPQSVSSGENNASCPASPSLENSIPDSFEDGETHEEGEDEACHSEDSLTMDGVLKPTRSGRQPKKRFLFTIDNTEPKKRSKKTKLSDDNTAAVSDGCTQLLLAIEQDNSDSIATSSEVICDEYLTDGFSMNSNDVGIPGTVFLSSAETGMAEQVVAVTKTKQEDEEIYDEFVPDNNVLEGVLKQTRSGRQPKMKSVFTIDNPSPKKRAVASLISPSENVNTYTPLAQDNMSPLSTILAKSPSQLYLLAEKPSEDGSQVVHFYMMSPPVQPRPVANAVSPIVTDHDYVLQTLANASGDSVMTLASDLQTLDPNI